MAETTNRKEWEGPRLTPEQYTAVVQLATQQGATMSASGQLDPTAGFNIDALLQSITGTGTGTSSGSVTLPTQYNDGAADEILTQAMINLVGYAPDANTKKAFRAGLKNFMKQFGSRSRSGGGSSQTTAGLDADVFVKQFVSGIIRTSLAQNPNLELGGQYGETMNALNDYVSAMGLFKTTNEVAGLTADVVTGTRNAKDVTSEMRKQAMALYSGFAKRLQEDSNLTVRDLANPYIQMMSDTFEIDSNNVRLTDDTLQKAFSNPDGMMSLGDFRSMLRKDSRFETTVGAKREAFDLATGFARAFGFGA